ncbi:MBOAT, membrane-bound O-acyltransferase family-domain-containing protein [Dissophora ornata]|nr:hypothetical protein BGZ58_006004 [Dissophora ornata]KAI8596305.1 MBOAT, membrane-bound O-acyltransferase family-domain-containing protein [Dissophora ornata]
MDEEPVNVLLTPPPDSDHRTPLPKSMDPDIASYPTMQRRPSRPLDDSSEEETIAIHASHFTQDQQEKEILDEDTTTTTTTTTTTAKVPRRQSKNLEGLVAHHQAVHQKFTASPPANNNGLGIAEGELLDASMPAALNAVGKDGTMETTTRQSNATAIRAPSGTISQLKTDQSTPETASSTTTSDPSVQQHGSGPLDSALHPLAGDRLRKDVSHLLSTSSSTNSLASTRSSLDPGTSSSVEGFHTITTSTVTTRKRKVRRPTFEPRTSRLDPETMTRTQDPFRGFHTLFWIIMGAYGVITFDSEWTKVGRAFGGTLFSSFSQDAIMLAISDLGLVLSTGMAFLLIKTIAKGWVRYRVAGMVIQHSLQLLFLLLAIVWTIWRDWPWVQSGFFTLHAITMLMKIHSYIAYNGELSEKLIQLKNIEAAYCQMKRTDAETTDDIDDDLKSFSSSIDSLPNTFNNDTATSDQDHEQDAIRRRHHRLASEAAEALLQDPVSDPAALSASMMASEIDELKSELRCQNGELWPANVTAANFLDYLIVPTLIYELQYPRTTRIRPMYVFEKVVATLGTFTLLYLTTEHYIYPVVFDPTISPMRALVLLLIPFMTNYILIFYIIFECICNAFAELSRFADRNFYEDWWNSIGFDEWARKWNKPVHNFLLRHVYDSSIEAFHLSKANAAFATFFLSSCVHELVMMVVTRKVRLYLFSLQMFQLPLIWMGNNKTIREQPRLANAIFWLGMFCGPPLLGVAYCYA